MQQIIDRTLGLNSIGSIRGNNYASSLVIKSGNLHDEFKRKKYVNTKTCIKTTCDICNQLSLCSSNNNTWVCDTCKNTISRRSFVSLKLSNLFKKDATFFSKIDFEIIYICIPSNVIQNLRPGSFTSIERKILKDKNAEVFGTLNLGNADVPLLELTDVISDIIYVRGKDGSEAAFKLEN